MMSSLRQIRGEDIELVGRWVVGAVFERDGVVRGQGNLGVDGRVDRASEKDAVGVDFPARGQQQLWREAKFGETFRPDGEKIVKLLVGLLLRRLDMDDAVGGMRVQPVDAGTIGR